LNGPNFDGFVVRSSEKGCVVVAELKKRGNKLYKVSQAALITHLNRPNGPSVTFDYAGACTGQVCAPQSNSAIARGRCDEVTLRRDGHTIYTAFMLTEAICSQVCLEVPKHDTVVVASTHHLFHIGKKCSAVDGGAVATKRAFKSGVDGHCESASGKKEVGF
jgi:hypothetical protein